jgi:hypothetical protein
MADVRQSSFGAGEFSPSLYGADHLPQYAEGARTLRNFFVSKYRTALTRPGTIFCHEVKDSAKLTRLLPFLFSNDQAYALELGDGNLRITEADGSRVMADGLVALGAQISKSTDEDGTWTTVQASFSGPRAACTGADGRIVIVGYKNAAGWVAYTDDLGTTITEVDVSALGLGGAPIYSVAFNGRRLVAGVYDGRILYSDDNGATWHLAPAPPTGMIVQGVTWGKDRWIAVGSASSKARYSFSYDGESWAAPAAVGDLDASYTNSTLQGVAYCAGAFVAAGYTTSPSAKGLLCQIGVLGSSWKWSVTAVANESLYGVAASATKALAVGASTGKGVYEYDSLTGAWTELAAAPGNDFYYAITYSRGYWVMVGTSFPSYFCARYDGSVWEDLTIPGSNGNYYAIAAGTGPERLELETPWPTSVLRDLATAQSGDIQTIFHQEYAPRELRRYALHDWRLEDWYKTPPTRKVTGLAFSPSANQTEDATHVVQPWEVVVTWEDEDGRESLSSAALVGPTSGKFLVYPDKIQAYVWNVVENARRYHVYRGQNGEWGWIGSAKQPTAAAGGAAPTTATFTDKGQAPIYSEQPPTWDNPFLSHLAFPACGCYFDDRLVVGGSLVAPTKVKGSRVSDYYNFDEVLIPSDTSAFEHTLAARQFEEIRWIVPVEKLLIGTSRGAWILDGAGGAPLTEESVSARPLAGRSSSRLQPIIAGDLVVFAQGGGKVVRAISVRDPSRQEDASLFGGQELSILSAHLLEGYAIVDWAYADEPHSVVWAVRADGALLSLTIIREHGIAAWARHDTEGDVFEAVTAVPDGARDVPFFIVQRTINGQTKRYVERMATREPATAAAGVFLDCAVTQTIAAGNAVSNLSHLEGRTVAVLADGTYRGTYAVAAGAVTFTGAAATTVTVGLPITYDFEALDYPAGRTKQKKVARVAVEYRQHPPVADTTIGVQLGDDVSRLSGTRRFSDAREEGLLEVPIDAAYNPGGRCFLRYTAPFPLEIRGITREVR